MQEDQYKQRGKIVGLKSSNRKASASIKQSVKNLQMNNQDTEIAPSAILGVMNQGSNGSTPPRDNKTDSTHRLSKNMSQNHNEQGCSGGSNILIHP